MRFRRLASGAPAHDCGQLDAGTQNESMMHVRSETGTVAEVLVVDGSGVVQYFHRDRWSTLLDPVTAGDRSYLCQVVPRQGLWIGPGRALLLNRAVDGGRAQVIRLELDAEARPSFLDDGLPSAIGGAGRLLDLGARGLYAGGGRGHIARRDDRGWALLQPGTALTRNTAILFAGPEGSLIVGNGGEGLAQYWPEEPGGPLACASVANNTFVRDAGRAGASHIVGLPSNEGRSRSVFAWAFRPPAVCELPPN